LQPADVQGGVIDTAAVAETAVSSTATQTLEPLLMLLHTIGGGTHRSTGHGGTGTGGGSIGISISGQSKIGSGDAPTEQSLMNRKSTVGT
jgi:hypothetical protein